MRDGEVEAVIEELAAMPGQGAKTAWAEAEYFRKLRGRMRQPGMRWSVRDANKGLAVRMVYLSEDWEQINWANKRAA